MSPLLRRRRAADGIAADGLKARRPHAGLLRRERRALLKARADAVADLGGLLVEMYRRGGFRDDLLAERAAAIVGIDGRLAEIETLLHTGRRVPRCECGAPLLRGSRFCPNCGRPLGQAEPAREDVSDETVVEPAPKH
ncbi:MAG: zinc-ribbon domain-containing protein [Gaiellaceae bacterium]